MSADARRRAARFIAIRRAHARRNGYEVFQHAAENAAENAAYFLSKDDVETARDYAAAWALLDDRRRHALDFLPSAPRSAVSS